MLRQIKARFVTLQTKVDTRMRKSQLQYKSNYYHRVRETRPPQVKTMSLLTNSL